VEPGPEQTTLDDWVGPWNGKKASKRECKKSTRLPAPSLGGTAPLNDVSKGKK